jgi:glucose/arabinose dehydrogenase
MRKILVVLGSVMVIGGLLFLFRGRIEKIFFTPTPSSIEEGVSSKDVKPKVERKDEIPVKDIEVVAENLNIPWEIVFLPTGEMLVTERPGRLLKVGKDKKVISEIEGVEHVGEGGLMGMTLHPDFAKNRWVYLYLTTRKGGGLVNRVERYRFEGDSLAGKEIILEGILGAQFHDGGRIEFGPDGLLYITTGDAGNKPAAQDTSSLNGKILRISDDGSIPEDNPFGNAVYSYGHRNPQGLAWDDQDRLWITEHGPSGLQSGFDEVNLILKGGNFGWPEIQGDEKKQGMITPLAQSGADDTWAPAGVEYLENSLFFAGLRGEALYQAVIGPDDRLDIRMHFRKEFGRLRAVKLGPDGLLYVSTSNTDGRGTKNPGDDKIIRINPNIF